MSEPREQKRAAIEAVARHVSAAWQADGDNAYISIAGKRIAVDVAIAEQVVADRTDLVRPHLRFDNVARRLIGHLQEAMRASVPEGTAALVTVTAPIRLATKTALALEAAVRDQLVQGPGQTDREVSIHGNQVRVRVVQSSARLGSKVIVFVHNPDTDAARLLDIAQLLLQLVGAAAERRPLARSVSERWLVMLIEDGAEQIATYRQLYGQLPIAVDFVRVLMVSGGGRVATLME